MISKETLHIAVGVVLAVVALKLVKAFLPQPAPRHADGSELIPGQARA